MGKAKQFKDKDCQTGGKNPAMDFLRNMVKT